MIRSLAVVALIGACIPFILEQIDRSVEYPVNAGGVVVLTGATSGLGKDAAFFLAKEGYLVVAGARNDAKAKILEAEAKEAGVPAGKLQAIVLEAGDDSHYANAVEVAKATMKRENVAFTGLINNAGVHDRMIQGTDELATMRKVYDVNVFAPVALVKAFDELLTESKGRIVNVGSVAGEVNIAGGGTYCSSKFAIKSITEVMRVEYGPKGVSVSLIAPGYVKSQMCDPTKNEKCGLLG
jgi:NAD(P)-dependent dehydrogenase (short-subunit alcohol dehydrogenase family)